MISVIIPTYNKTNILYNTVRQLIQQTYSKLEIIVVNDGGHNNIKENLLNIYPNIKYIYHKKQLGTIAARKTGLDHASSNLIAFLDDDDVWDNQKLIFQKKILDQNSHLDFVICNYKVNDQIQNKSYLVDLGPFVNNYKKTILTKPGPFLQCCLFNVSFIKKYYYLFDNNALPSEDWDWFISISQFNPKIMNINHVLFTWNLNLNSQSANIANEVKAIEYIIKKHKKYFLKYTNANNLSLQYRRIAGMYKILNKYNLMKKYYNIAFQCNRLSLKNIFYKLKYII